MTDFIVDGRFSPEGLSVSAYDSNGRLIDEIWYTWAEIEDLKSEEESHFTFEL